MAAPIQTFERTAEGDFAALQDRIEIFVKQLVEHQLLQYKLGEALDGNEQNILGIDTLESSVDNASGGNGRLSLRNTVLAWGRFYCNGTSNPSYTEAGTYNMSAIARATTGTYNITTSGIENHIAVFTGLSDMSTPFILQAAASSTTNIQVLTRDTSGTLADVGTGIILNVLVVGY